MSAGSRRVSVIGAGVNGLTSAVLLAESGVEVHVLARDLPPETTSAVAGGLWLPYLAGPADRVAAWSRRTYEVLAGLAADPETGVELRDGVLLHRAEPARPPWADGLAGLTGLDAVRDPAPGYGHGWRLRAPVVAMPRYLRYLTTRLVRAGGTLTRMSLPALPARGLVVNCTGVAARALAADPAVHPVRGEVVLVEDPGIPGFLSDDQGPDGSATYVIPRGGQVVLGGTAERDVWSTTPDPSAAELILARARRLEPRLTGARVLGHRVGLRPARHAVRVEVQRPLRPDGATIVHCYGHGGSGLTLSWGTAEEAAAAVLAELDGRDRPAGTAAAR